MVWICDVEGCKEKEVDGWLYCFHEALLGLIEALC